ncbi:hypothetical protein FQA39_LY14036 [Lamprigera yunnana]|nr:hypothetical protein FQA39_LY14036 [Lamprigera yunnana]
MPGEVLNSQSQMFVIKLLQYFEQEKENGGPLISVLSVQQLAEVCDTISTQVENFSNVVYDVTYFHAASLDRTIRLTHAHHSAQIATLTSKIQDLKLILNRDKSIQEAEDVNHIIPALTSNQLIGPHSIEFIQTNEVMTQSDSQGYGSTSCPSSLVSSPSRTSKTIDDSSSIHTCPDTNLSQITEAPSLSWADESELLEQDISPIIISPLAKVETQCPNRLKKQALNSSSHNAVELI